MPRSITAIPYGIHPSAHGGALRKSSQGRGARTLSVRHSMHLVMRSSLAKGAWSFVRGRNRALVEAVIKKQAAASQVEVFAIGNAGNHLHLRVKFNQKRSYMRFIRAIAGEIALKIKKVPNSQGVLNRNFWDQRPFSCIVSGAQYVARLTDYIKINDLEGQGFTRAFAKLIIKKFRDPQTRRPMTYAELTAGP